jgi:hypothetical protein
MGWSGIKNGELLARMKEERFDVFLTGDRKSTVSAASPRSWYRCGLLSARSTPLADILPHIPELLTRLPSLQPGTLTVIPDATRS